MEKNNIENILKVITVFVVIAGIITIYYYNKSVEDTKILNYLIIILGFIACAFLIYKGNIIWNYINHENVNDDKKTPNPLSGNEVQMMVKNDVFKNENYMNEVEKIIETRVRHENDCVIYHMIVKLLYKDEDDKFGYIKEVIINANYPERGCSILNHPGKYLTEKMIKSSSSLKESEEENTSKKTTVINPNTGVIVKTSEPNEKKEEFS